MKHPEDLRTIELPLDPSAPRKRGRPPKDDKMSDAERARRYRARQRMLPKGEWNYEQLTAQARGEIARMLDGRTGHPLGLWHVPAVGPGDGPDPARGRPARPFGAGVGLAPIP
jgi:hypothetical protein